jgi:phosphoenolpyruvate phosphomutase
MPMRILIASPIDPGAIRALEQEHDVVCAFNAPEEELKRRIIDRDMMVFRSGVDLSTKVLDCGPELKLIVRAGCGVDNLDLDYVRTRGIEFARIPEPAAQAVGEMTIAMMLSLARNLREADRLWRQGRWAKYEIEAYLLRGKTLGIVGAGNIGSRVGQLGAALGMTPVGCVKTNTPAAAADLAEKGIRLTSFDEVVSLADFLCIHVPLNSSTRNLIDAGVLARVKPGAYLVNLARGGVVNEAALYQQLLPGGRLRGAALDVHEREGEGKVSPLAELSNVILTPHIGAMTVDTQREIGQRVLEITRSFAGRGNGTRPAIPTGNPKANGSAHRELLGSSKPMGAQTKMTPKTSQLKALLHSGKLEFLLEAHNGLSARIVEEAGFKGIWASGLTISASLGVRDNNEASWTQVLEVVEFMSDASNIPILLDGDTGYGNFNNVRRLIRKLEQRGVAGVCIEDKLFPKTNSFINGEQQPLAKIEEFVGKIKAAKDSQHDPDFCLVARIEALIAGWGMAEALKRAQAYFEAGADALLVHSKLSDAAEILGFMERWGDTCPVAIVPTMYYQTPVQQFADAGVSVAIWANHLMRGSVKTMQSIAREVYEAQSILSVEEKIVPVKEVFRLQQVEELRAAELIYLPNGNGSQRPNGNGHIGPSRATPLAKAKLFRESRA